MKDVLTTVLDLLRWLLGRPRLAVRIVRDDVTGDGPSLVFEVENRGGTPTSLLPEIRVTYYYLSRLRVTKGTNRYYVREVDRRLEPFQPRVLTATPDLVPAHYTFSWYRTYVFSPSRGLGTRVRLRNALLEPVSRAKFFFELFRLRTRGKVPRDQHDSIEDLERLRRRLGPH